MILTRPRLALLALICLVALAGCGGSGSGGSTAGGSTASESFAGGAQDGVARDSGAKALPVAQAAKPGVEVQQQAIIRTGTISIRTADPQQARDRVDLLLTRLHGSVDGEQTVYDKSGRIRDSHLVLRVPVDSFGTAMSDLERLGTVVHSSSTGQDVTTEVIDVEQRLRTLRISLHDLNAFQRRAATIDQLLRFENAITQRRGEYQSLKAQRDHLANQTSMSTINLDVAVPPAQAAATGHHHRAGFVTGLRHGWAALTGTLQVALTALGAALPFALVLGLAGLPLWWLRRGGLSREDAEEVTDPPGQTS